MKEKFQSSQGAVEKAYRRTTYLLATIGFLTLLITREIPGYLVFAILFTLFASYFNHTRSKPLHIPNFFWNLISVLFFLYEALMAIYSSRELILNVTEFLIVLQIVRLWLLKNDRDYLQVYGLSLLHLIAASVLTAELVFSILFITYIIFGTWALVVFNLQRELQGNRQNFVGGENVFTVQFFMVLSVVSVLVFFSSLTIFFLFPRLNYNYFASFLQKGSPQSGFSNQVRLGEIGKIKLNQTPVMRVTLSGPGSRNFSQGDLYLKGVTLENYDGARWLSIPRDDRQMITIHRVDYYPFVHVPKSKADLIQDIVMEPSGNDVLFSLSQPIGIEAPFGIVSHRSGEGLIGSFAGSQRVKYTIFSKNPNPKEENLRKLFRDQRKEQLDRSDFEEYLQLPKNLDPRFGELSREITRGSDNHFDRAQRIERYLSNTLGYTLEMVDSGDQDPLVFFLFERKAGHCEYFASSMAIMLRTLGIPTRMVNGYYYGERNEIGNFFLIRESHAHTWVEVFDPKLGWTRFDPTPADPSLFEPLSTWDRIRQIFESAQLQWVNWIVDYSIHQQRQGVQNVNQKTQTVRHNTRMQWFTLRQEFRKFFSDTSLMQNILAVFFAFLALTFLLYWLIRGLRSGRRRKKEEPIIFYEKTLHLLARKGISRCPEWTPHEFQAFAQERLADPMARKSFEEITELFCEIRYGQRPQNLALEKRTHQLLRDLRQGLRG